MEEVTILHDNHVHDQVVVRDHCIVEDIGKFCIVTNKIPQILSMRRLEDSRTWHLVQEPFTKVEERGHQDPTEI